VDQHAEIIGAAREEFDVEFGHERIPAEGGSLWRM
jgi:hypothetical protein